MGTNDDSVRVVRDADGNPVGEWRLVAVPISPEERQAMLDAPSVGPVGSPGGGGNQFAGTCGTDAPGVGHPFWASGGTFLDEAGLREWDEEYRRLCDAAMAAKVEQFQSLMRGWEEELKGVVPGVGLPKGVEVVREGVTASEVRSVAVNTRPLRWRTGPRRPEFAWIDNYEVVCVPSPTLEEAFGPDEPGFWWVRGTDWVRDDAIREDWAVRCQLESQGSEEDQAALMRRVESMLLESGASWEGSESVLGATCCDDCGGDTPVLSALEEALAGIGGHFPALWCGEVPLLGGWRSSWTWDDWRGDGSGWLGPVESIAFHVVPKFRYCPSVFPVPAPSIGAQLGSLGGPWPVTDGGWLEQSLWLTAWDRELVRGVRDARGCDLLAWMVPGAGTIPDGEREQDRAFRAWLEKCVSCPLNGGDGV